MSAVGVMLSRSDVKSTMFWYYSELFSDGHQGLRRIAEFSEVNRLSDMASRELMQPVTQPELEHALSLCKKKKSPGLDGLPYEFYDKNLETLAPEMLAIYNGILQGTIQPREDWTQGAVVFIRKKMDARRPEDYMTHYTP